MSIAYIQRLSTDHPLISSPRLRVALAAVLILAVGVIHAVLIHVGPLPGDNWAVYHFSGWQIANQPRPLRMLGNLLNSFGQAPVAALVFAIALWRLAAGRCWAELAGLLIVYLAVLANALLKAFFGPTPLWLQTFHAAANFPSGHTTYATAVFGYLALLAHRHHRRWAVWLALAVVVLMGPTRVTSGSHLPSDVLAGYLLGGAFLALASAWLTYYDRRRSAEQSLPV